MSVGVVDKQTGDRIPTAGMSAIDSILSGSSTNPVQNRVVKAALDKKADTDLVASDFDATASYTAGNYCIYEGKFYKFKNNHSGAWAAADVDEIQIAGELSSIKSGLTNYENQNDINLEVPNRKNLLNYDVWSNGVFGIKCTIVAENNGATLTATDNDAYTVYKANEFPLDARVPVKAGDTITMSWVEELNKSGVVYIFGDGNTVLASVNNNVAKQISCTIPNGVTFVTFRLGVSDVGETISYKNIQIEHGSTSTPYTPYIASVESRLAALEAAVFNS